jgi:ABC-2 type transport system permease protein
MSGVRLWAISRKEILQFRRDPRSLLLAFLLPVLLLILFGYAITWDVRNIATVVVDQDRSRATRDLIAAFQASGYFRLQAVAESAAEAEAAIARGAAQLALIIPPGFSADLGAGRAAPLQAIVDGCDANTATIILAYAQAIVQAFSAGGGAGTPSLSSTFLGTGARMQPPVSAATRVWYNEEMLSRNMIVPGLIAVIMMIIAAMLTSLTIAREWERGTMEQLAATPVARLEVVMLMGASVFFLIGALGLGIFISSVARSQLLATQMAMVLTFLPAYLLSGFMFSIDVMPKALQLITYIIPARYFLVVIRGLYLKGVGPEVLYVQGLSMLIFAAVGITLATRVFRKELA